MMKKTVLLAGECGTTLMFEKLILGEGSYDYLTASTGRDAVDLAVANRPDLILLDNRLLEMNALETCKAIRDQGQSVPIIIATATPDATFVEKSIELGCNGHVRKPFIAADLVTTVQRHLM